MNLSSSLNVFTDGGSRGNPGPAAVGVVVKDNIHQTLSSFGQCIGITTNNVAEYQAVIIALEWLKKKNFSVASLNFFLDSTLVVNQLNGLWKIKDARLRQKVIYIRRLEADLNTKVAYFAIPRIKNAAADFQVNLALDNKL